MKKYVFTENQIKSVIKSNITEQTEERKELRSIQQFLNQWKNNYLKSPDRKIKEDGVYGDETKKAIEEYQTFLIKQYGADITVDGVWGIRTERSMPDPHKKMLNHFRNKNADIFDKFLNIFK